MKSKKLEKEIRVLFFWWEKLYQCAWHSTALHDSEKNKSVRFEIEQKLLEIKSLLREHYGPKIGAAIISEIQS